MPEENPLVSIIVITYNSSKYLLETLESAKAQTYQNIELIISDDASADDTVEVCRKWVEDNKGRFVRTEIITVPENTGIPANCNRGVRAAKGEWVKLIAGDDVMDKDLIQKLILFAGIDKSVVCSDYYICEEDIFNIVSETSLSEKPFFKSYSANEQFQYALRTSGTVPPLTSMYKRSVFDLVGGFDEAFLILEDYPFFAKLNEKGIKIDVLAEKLAYYRKHRTAVTKSYYKHMHPIFLHTHQFQKNYCAKRVPFIEGLGMYANYYKTLIIIKVFKNNPSYSPFYKILNFFNPFFLYRKALNLAGITYKFENYLRNK